jgi:hypothetical protein
MIMYLNETLAIADILYKDDLEMLEAAQIDLYEELS